MTAPPPPPTLGRVRKQHREGLDMDVLDLLERVLDWEPLHDQAATLPTLSPGSAGRRPDFPPVMALIFGLLYWLGPKSQRKVARMLKHERTWELVRSRLAPRFPDYPGFGKGAMPYNRSDYRRYVGTYGMLDTAFGAIYDEFTRYWTDQAVSMGMFDTSKGSLSHPEPSSLLSGDVTVLRALYDATPGETRVHPDTGEISPKRHDPDARWYQTGDKRNVYGTPFGFLSGSLFAEGERLVLGIFQTEDGGPDPQEGMRAMACAAHLRSLLPGLTGIVYDKALRGKHVQIGFEIDVPVFAKVARKSKGDKGKAGILTSRNLGRRPFSLLDGSRQDLTVWAIDGAPHIEAMVAGKVNHVRLARGQIIKRRNSAKGRNRWYCTLTVPADPRVPARTQGASVTLRLDRPRPADTWWTEVLRGIPEGDPDWQSVYGRRNASESLNSWLKEFTRDKRAPCVGRAQQRFALLCAAMAANFKALVLFCQRRGRSIPGLALPPP